MGTTVAFRIASLLRYDDADRRGSPARSRIIDDASRDTRQALTIVVPQSPSAFAARVTRALAALRKERGITVEVLAERLGTAVQNVRRIEAGQNLTLAPGPLRSGHRVTVEVVFKRTERTPHGRAGPQD